MAEVNTNLDHGLRQTQICVRVIEIIFGLKKIYHRPFCLIFPVFREFNI